MIKIQGEHTRPTDAPTLCETCQYATIVRGTRFGDDFVMCNAMEPSRVIRFTVASCSAYSDKRVPSVHVYLEKGWIWMQDIDRFISPNEKYRVAQQQHAANVAAKQTTPVAAWRRIWAILRGR